jgi:hypothetical protein
METEGNIEEAKNIYIRLRVAQFDKTDGEADC